MSLLERYEQQAVLLDQPRSRGYSAITDVDFCDLESLNLIAGQQMRGWKEAQRRLEASGLPLALQGGIAGLEAFPPSDALAAITLSATEQALWAAATYTPLAAGQQRSPVHYSLYAAGTVTTTATASPTMLLTPRWGTAITDATLGATPSIVLTASQTACPWFIRGELTVRGTGGPGGTNARVYGTFNMSGKFVTPANGIVDANHIFGYTAATGDSSIAKGLFMGIVSTITTPTVTVQQIKFGSWN
jgi:hypothetical protein